ncbi:MAG: hypothetical protein B7X53_01285 [Hyphomonas sp. 34-62-18]|nr:MAG: hypothetical protein B7X53_01285 [Hyphomonas sp. 34-62-18]
MVTRRVSSRWKSRVSSQQKSTRTLSNADTPRPFPAETAVEALTDIWSILQAADAECFLAAGTLLGFYRNGGPLPHDRDIDIGVLRYSDGTPHIADILRAHPLISLRGGARRGDRYFALTHKGIAIDIFLYEETSCGIVCGFSENPGDIQWRFSPFDLAQVRYQGRDWRIPSPTDRHLSEVYGASWREPNLGFASAVSSPSLFRTDANARAYIGTARARRHLTAGDCAKAKALLDQSPLPFRGGVITAIERLCAYREHGT